jgi:Ankyrin repeats (many copies)
MKKGKRKTPATDDIKESPKKIRFFEDDFIAELARLECCAPCPDVKELNWKYKKAPIYKEIYENDVKALTALLKDNKEYSAARRHFINMPEVNLNPPLFFACQLGHVEAARVLLENGADPHCLNAEGVSPLAYAVMSGKPEMLMLFWEYAPNLLQSLNFVSWVQIIENALQYRQTRLLIRILSRFLERDNKNVCLCLVLLLFKGCPSLQVLALAIIEDFFRIIKELMVQEGAAFFKYLLRGDSGFLLGLLHKQDFREILLSDKGIELLFCASELNHTSCLDFIIRHYPSLLTSANIINIQELHNYQGPGIEIDYAAHRAVPNFLTFIIHNNVEVFKKYIEENPEVLKWREKYYKNLPYYAAGYGRVKILKELYAKKPDLFFLDDYSVVKVMVGYASGMMNHINYPALVEGLLAHHEPVKKWFIQKITESGFAIKLFVLDVFAKNTSIGNDHPNFIKHVMIHDNLNGFQWQIRNDSPMSWRNSKNRNIVHLAFAYGALEIIKFIFNDRTCRHLFDARDVLQQTPIVRAALSKKIEISKKLEILEWVHKNHPEAFKVGFIAERYIIDLFKFLLKKTCGFIDIDMLRFFHKHYPQYLRMPEIKMTEVESLDQIKEFKFDSNVLFICKHGDEIREIMSNDFENVRYTSGLEKSIERLIGPIPKYPDVLEGEKISLEFYRYFYGTSLYRDSFEKLDEDRYIDERVRDYAHILGISSWTLDESKELWNITEQNWAEMQSCVTVYLDLMALPGFVELLVTIIGAYLGGLPYERIAQWALEEKDSVRDRFLTRALMRSDIFRPDLPVVKRVLIERRQKEFKELQERIAHPPYRGRFLYSAPSGAFQEKASSEALRL